MGIILRLDIHIILPSLATLFTYSSTAKAVTGIYRIILVFDNKLRLPRYNYKNL